MIDVVEPDWDAPPGVRALCTTRFGGVSRAPYDSLNLGLHVGDAEEDVRRNRARLRRELALPAEPEWISQTHGTRCVVLEQEPGRDADGAITREPGRVAVVMVADCLPLLLCNRDGTEVAALHAGWRGLQAGVVRAGIEGMQSRAADLLAWVGPGISRHHFEVGDEVLEAFQATHDGAAQFFQPHGDGHWMCDLAGLAERELERLGVGRVLRDTHCTYRDAERFYSYRRDRVTGRMAALIWIN